MARGLRRHRGGESNSKSPNSKSPSSKSVAHRALALLTCVIFAAVAIGNGLDRRSFLRPIAASKVPAAFADTALATRGQAALSAGRYSEMLALGEAAVRRSPIEPVAPALLGSARLAIGDTAGADRAFRIAGQMGWRVPLTQAYWMQQAIALKDWRVAAERFDALLRQQPWMADDAPLLATIEVWPEGRQAIVDRLAKSPARWIDAYARGVDGRDGPGLARHSEVLVMLAARGIIVGCDAIAPLTNRLAERGRPAEAQAQWRQHCPEAGTGLLADPRLVHARPTSARSYFEWELVGSSDVGMVLVPEGDGGSKALELHNASALPRVVLRQLMALPPGAYQVGWRARTTAGKTSPQVVASFGCSPEQAGRLSAAARNDAGQWSAELRVAGNCPAHWLLFTVLPGEGDVRLGDLSLERK